MRRAGPTSPHWPAPRPIAPAHRSRRFRRCWPLFRAVSACAAVVRLLISSRAFPSSLNLHMHASPTAAHTDARDPVTALMRQQAEKKQQAAAAAHLSHVHSFQFQQAMPHMHMHAQQQTGQGHAQPSPSGTFAGLQLAPPPAAASAAAAAPSDGAKPQPFVLPTSMPAPPTAAQKLPWDHTGVAHASIITAHSASTRGREGWRARFAAKKVAEKMDAIKLKHRSSLKLHDWQRYGYKEKFEQLRAEAFASMPRPASGDGDILADGRAASAYVPQQPAKAGAPPPKPALHYSIDRVHWKELSLEQFRTRYEIPKSQCEWQGRAGRAGAGWAAGPTCRPE